MWIKMKMTIFNKIIWCIDCIDLREQKEMSGPYFFIKENFPNWLIIAISCQHYMESLIQSRMYLILFYSGCLVFTSCFMRNVDINVHANNRQISRWRHNKFWRKTIKCMRVLRIDIIIERFHFWIAPLPAIAEWYYSVLVVVSLTDILYYCLISCQPATPTTNCN